MTAHPLDTILQTGVAVSKGDFSDYAKKTFLADNAAQVADTNLSGSLFVLCPVSTGLGLFVYDSSDTTSAQDLNAGVLRSNDDRVYKRQVLGSSDIQGFVLAAITAAGGVDAAQLASGDADTLFGRDGSGAGANLTMANLVALLDTFIGDSEWRSPVAQNDVSKIARLPENRRAGGDVFYALMSDGRVRAAGDGASFANGSDASVDANRLAAIAVVAGTPTFTKIWSGGSQCFALDDAGHPWAMGRNSEGQLGLGDTVNRAAFEEIAYFRTNSLTVTDIVLGYGQGVTNGPRGAEFVVFVCDNGKAYFNGLNDSGQAGDGTTTDVVSPQPWGSDYTAGGVTSIDGVWVTGSPPSPGAAVYVSRTNGDVIASGYDGTGAFALGTTSSVRSTPVKLTAVTNVVQIASDALTTLYRLSDGTLKAAGRGGSGQRGDGTTDTNTSPAYGVVTVSLGGDCLDVFMPQGGGGTAPVGAIVDTGSGDRTLKLWGENSTGACGTGDTTDQSTPFEPSEIWNGAVDEAVIGGDGGFYSTYARVGNVLYSVGYNLRSNLVRAGTDDVDQTTFGAVSGIVGTVEDWHICGHTSRSALYLKADKTVLAGGQNLSGKLGIDGTNDGRYATLQDVVTPNPSGPNPVASPPPFTVATLPDADAYPEGTSIYVRDEAGGAVTAFTDGTNWRRSTDRAVVS